MISSIDPEKDADVERVQKIHKNFYHINFQ